MSKFVNWIKRLFFVEYIIKKLYIADIANGESVPKYIMVFFIGLVFFVLFVLSYLLILMFGGKIININFLPEIDDFLASAMWAQVFVAIAGAFVSYYLLNQVRLAQAQLALNRKTATAEAAKVLTSDKIMNVKRFLNQKEVGDYFCEFVSRYKVDLSGEYGDYTHDLYQFNEDLMRIRREVSDLSFKLSPFFCRVTLEDIEKLLNEYNYIGMLISHGVFDTPLITDMAMKNAKNVYSIIKPYIFFRKKPPGHRDGYASHYIHWVSGSFVQKS